MTDADETGMAPDEPKPAPKVDPETLVLRARPTRAIRFKRGAVVGLAALASISVVATAWVALRPTAFRMVSQNDERSEPGKPSSEALSGLPTSYDDAPKLGAPLPGDLGKPFLESRASMATEGGQGTGAAQEAEQAAAAERQRQVAELKAARESGLMAKSGNAMPEQQATAITGDTSASANAPAKLAVDADRDPNAQQRKSDFVGSIDKGGDTNPHALTAAVSPYTLSAGSVISASLITGLRSDLPGLVTAQVTERVFDSATGQILLIPQGARLIGSYDSVVAFGQKRALVVWQRIILPDGRSMTIDNVPATDPSGYAGLADKVDFHTWQLLKGVVLSTVLGVGSSLTFTGESDLVQAIRESTQQNVSRAGDQLTSKNLQIQPSITIRPGAPVRLVVHRDLILAPWHE
ncbi:TrbI/VirB10 family protein (plasmid) [Sphingomonas paeninsulae]|uniref:TrbI/VirB10 family protein n=1 Tax=Sphingomonas paeninsulae TaxID=2319844 RepID=A0A494THA6_SPHPE|nr:TrbI/VirB10 family protein [Sphingomonas paeninsulae]AYJ84818.1 TrbI/VirB10 family protein [Sphingomonas paeninsulae]